MRMYGLSTIAAALLLVAAGSRAAAIPPVDFEIRNNADLVALCSVQPGDPNYVAAIHFCHGFGVGFYRYHLALTVGKEYRSLFCIPETMTRNQVLDEYVRYSKAHPEYDTAAVGDAMTKFLVDTFPCKAK